MTRVNPGEVLRRGTIAPEQTEPRTTEDVLHSGGLDICRPRPGRRIIGT